MYTDTTSIKIKPKPAPHGFIHRRFHGLPICIYNGRGKLILWSGGRWMPVNGPALWVTLFLCLIVGFIGGHL